MGGNIVEMTNSISTLRRPRLVPVTMLRRYKQRNPPRVILLVDNTEKLTSELINISAHGAVGKSLEHDASKFRLYISNDAGRTWRETLNGRYVFAVSDSGAITTALPMTPHIQHKTLQSSFSEGDSWKPIAFSSVDVTIDAVLTEPGWFYVLTKS